VRLLYSSNAAADLQEARSQRQEEYEIGCCRARARCQPQMKLNLVIYSEQHRRTFAGETKFLGHVTCRFCRTHGILSPTLHLVCPTCRTQAECTQLFGRKPTTARLQGFIEIQLY